MPFPPKKSIQSFAKKAATPPMAASMLAKKRAAVPPAAPPPAAAAAPPAAPAPEAPEEEQLMNMSEMLEEAAQEAEAMSNPELEDLIAGYSMEEDAEADPLKPPAWAEDAELWEHVAQTVGLDVPELAARYEEPFAVAAYLYAKMGGPIAANEEGSGEHEMGEEESDMEKPGTAAKAMSAVLKSRPKVPAPQSSGGM